MFTNRGSLSYDEHMTTTNDNVTHLPKPLLSASKWVTPITNQANVANRLREMIGKEAHDRVWSASPETWATIAREYVNLQFGYHYGTRWVRGTAGDRLRSPDPDKPVEATPPPITAMDHASILRSGYNDEAAVEHPRPAPLAALIRFVGGHR